VRALHLVKLKGSSFAGFLRDEYTTLPESADRPLFIHLDVDWRHESFRRRVPAEAVRESLVRTFDGFESRSIQHLVHEMGRRLLAAHAELAEVSFAAENRLWDTAATGESATVYTDPRPPYGVVTLTLSRDTDSLSASL
jgi:urate oxidase/2-oxo-4-hydroxy-4-carboxy-5-ureidoimidazoline decarboxylase